LTQQVHWLDFNKGKLHLLFILKFIMRQSLILQR
jgi:hypothetical protein